jgi:hypothetical protein
MAGLAYAQQQQVIAHTGFSQHAVRILSIIGFIYMQEIAGEDFF